MQEEPLVTVICLCYNHKEFVAETVESVRNQLYQHIEIIIIDDASTDGSAEEIEKFRGVDDIQILLLHENVGNCKAFNKGLALATGKYIIDLATDDVLLPFRISDQVAFFESLPEDYGVIFSNVEFINNAGHGIGIQYKVNQQGRSSAPVPEGDIFADVLARYFISPPSMMIKKSVLDELGGYDEQLAYEDFDFWIRSARRYKYAYQDKVLTRVRLLKGSKSDRLYQIDDPQLASTYQVCLHAEKLIKSKEEQTALVKRLKYEFRQAVTSENFKEAELFIQLLRKYTKLDVGLIFLDFINSRKIRLSWLRNIYHKVRYSSIS